MASPSSREAALERRKALTSGGKKSAGRYSSGPNRVRGAADARPTRTNVSLPSEAASSPPVSREPAPPSPRRASRPGVSFDSSRQSAAPSSEARRSTARPIANPSRELVLARREALSRRGKRADTSRDRTRNDQQKATSVAAAAAATPAKEHKCKCQETSPAMTLSSLSRGPDLSASLANRSGGRSSTPKRTAQHNPSRALVLARRDALSKRGKSANTSTNSAAATMARQGNPDMSSRELAQKVRELKCKVGSAGSSRSGGTRPSGPNRHGSKQTAVAEASLKVGVSETLSGQIVTGTQANRSTKTTGNEAATCRTITGTEYLGAEVFQTFCQGQGGSRQQPDKVRVSATSHGNRVTGNEVGRSEKVTGDEPGTCKNITGTEYVSANQSNIFCGGAASSSSIPSPRKVGHTQTQAGHTVSGLVIGRSEKVTGDEPGSGRQLTGNQYVNNSNLDARPAPAKVASLQTLRGTGITGTHVGRSDQVTGDEPGSCKIITGDEYIGSQQYDRFCGGRPAPEAAKVGFSVTNRQQVVSGTRTGRSEKVTGDEPGTCKIVTGTPYVGFEEASNWCSPEQAKAVLQRTPRRMGTVMSGIQPGIGGVMTGAQRGACEDVSGTPYVGPDQLAEACGAALPTDADFPRPLGDQPWEQFSVQSPAGVAHSSRERKSGVTGTGANYDQSTRVTGPFAMADDKITGTEHFRFDRGKRQPSRGPIKPVAVAAVSVDEDARPMSRVTGEGISAGLKITGDDWDRGERVTGTEGVSARRRNPSRQGALAAMPGLDLKRNEAVPAPVSRVTGGSGNSQTGSLITVSGGARG
ncbi:MAG: carboxysome shell protein [Cyanobacteria bacterium]|nr:carboxysome shell protein [Cyanobacteriota bacterium]